MYLFRSPKNLTRSDRISFVSHLGFYSIAILGVLLVYALIQVCFVEPCEFSVLIASSLTFSLLGFRMTVMNSQLEDLPLVRWTMAASGSAAIGLILLSTEPSWFAVLCSGLLGILFFGRENVWIQPAELVLPKLADDPTVESKLPELDQVVERDRQLVIETQHEGENSIEGEASHPGILSLESGETVAEEPLDLELSEEDEEESVNLFDDPAVTQQVIRSSIGDEEFVNFTVRATIPEKAERQVIHLPIWPALDEVPKVDAFVVSGTEARIRLGQAQRFGIRIELVKTTPLFETTETLVEVILRAKKKETECQRRKAA